MDYVNIPKEKLVLAKNRDAIHDKKLDTKPIGYFKDAWLRFRKNKGSVFAFGIIAFLVLFAIFVPMFTQYTVAYDDVYYRYNYPKNQICVDLGLNFWDGCTKKTVNEQTFIEYYAIGQETGKLAVKNEKFKLEELSNGDYYTFRLDTYNSTGCIFIKLSGEEFRKLQAYQDEFNIQVVYPAINKLPEGWETSYPQLVTNANLWYQVEEVYSTNPDGSVNTKKKKPVPYVERNADGSIKYDADGNMLFKTNYREYTAEQIASGDIYYDMYTSKMLIEGNSKKYQYAIQKQGDQYEVRVDYYEYYIYKHQYLLKDGISRPHFIFGSTHAGKDIFTCLASGARLSFVLAICVSAVNMIVGAIYGAIEGYYGGKLDLFMERFSDILSAVPFMIVITLLKMHMGGTSQLLILFIAFFLTGWIGMASRVRMQFYRFKNQEYVLAARTLGARDTRVMFKHIFPNSLGTIVTGSILSIPGMIFSESSLSYLGIINLQTGSMTSVGNMLASAQNYLTSYPYMMLFPALFICLLMLSFNLFGNGLRDAFNPSLRGAED